MSDEAGRLVFSRDPSGTFIDGEVLDVPDEQALDCLCLAIRCGGAWPVDGEGGGAMV